MEKTNLNTRRHQAMNRRSFLKLSGMLGLGVASVGLVPITAEAVKFDRKNYKVSKTTMAMGTFVSMTLIHPSRDEAEEAMERAFGEIERLSGLMNRFDEATAVAQLNKDGFLKDIPPEVILVVNEAIGYHRLTHGAFDISVKPIVDLFREKLAQGNRIPAIDRELKETLRLVDSGKIEVKGRSIAFKQPGMGLTLDGIAKGFIVDKASEVLAGGGIKNHLINAGGDIRTLGSKEAHKPWAVAIEDPMKRKAYPDLIHMRDGAVATSGNYEIYYDREKMFHHIVNPSTGLSPVLSASVSVLAKTTMAADALSTSVFVMGPSDGIGFINTQPLCECLIIGRNGSLSKSSGWKGQAI
ncbi:MAG: FAD:protein FMN transferase [Pseudomonadota bacterium]